MLVGFIGCPSSGKTTTAALVFAKLKSDGIVTEFISEQARFFIATKRCKEQLKPTDKISLTDRDQVEILQSQLHHERTFSQACGNDVIIVTDGSVYNSLLYMNDSFLDTGTVQNLVKSSHYDLLFHCQPIHFTCNLDPNRIHTNEQSLVIDKRIPFIKSKFPNIPKTLTLFGTSQERSNSVIDVIYQGLYSR